MCEHCPTEAKKPYQVGKWYIFDMFSPGAIGPYDSEGEAEKVRRSMNIAGDMYTQQWNGKRE